VKAPECNHKKVSSGLRPLAGCGAACSGVTATCEDVGDFPEQAKGAAVALRPSTSKNRFCAVLLVVQPAVATTAAVSAPIKSHARKIIPASPITALAVTPQQDLSTLSSMHIPFCYPISERDDPDRRSVTAGDTPPRRLPQVQKRQNDGCETVKKP